MGRINLTRSLSVRFDLPERSIRNVLRGRRPPTVDEQTASDILRAFDEALQGPTEPYSHARRAPRFATHQIALLTFLDGKGKVLGRAKGIVEDISIYGALLTDVRLRKGCLPSRFQKMLLQIEDMEIEARLRRLDLQGSVLFGVEFSGMDWKRRHALKLHLAQSELYTRG